MSKPFIVLLALVAVHVVSAQSVCSNSANVLLYGELTGGASQFVPWMTNNIPTINITQQPSTTAVSFASWSQFQLVIFFQMAFRNGPLTPTESNAVYQYVSQGGSVIALSGFDATPTDLVDQESVFAAFGVTYNPEASVVIGPEVVNTQSPLANGVSYLPFVGGWFSSPYPGTAQVSYVISSATATNFDGSGPLGQTIELPSPGGRMVVWGDEWITFANDASLSVSNFRAAGVPEGKTVSSGQFWKNAVVWAGNICVPGATVPPPSTCGPTVTASPSCDSVSSSSTGYSLSIAFDNTVSTCGN